ncbi:hypothetical protein ACFQMM_21340 [Saliphagus sp. GCM10025308]
MRRNGGPFGSDVGVRPWTVLERDGTRIGFTGVTTPRTVSLNPMATDIDVRDPVETARAAIDDLRDEGVDYVVVCSHLGRGDDALARQVDADVVLGGTFRAPGTRSSRGRYSRDPATAGRRSWTLRSSATGRLQRFGRRPNSSPTRTWSGRSKPSRPRRDSTK